MRWVRGIAAFVAALVAGLFWVVAHDSSAFVGDDSPEHLDSTYQTLSLFCLVKPLCPISSQALNEMKGALAGRSDAEYGLALTLLTGDGLPSDRAAGIAWMARAAEHGEPGAARDIYDRLRNGEGVTVDERQIAGALQKRVDAGDAEAMRALGPMIVRGRGVKQDPAAGVALMRRAFDLGATGAAGDLAHLYLLGAPGLPADRGQYLNWMQAAARRGDSEAMLSIGYAAMNPSGTSTDRDLTLSFCWLMRAALLDNPRAQEKLSLTFEQGETDGRVAIAADLIQADTWFRLAARNPFHDNSQIRGAIEPKMTSDEMDAAKRLVDAWRPRPFAELKTLPIALPAPTGAPPRLCPAMG
jgi:TPR repeat protein